MRVTIVFELYLLISQSAPFVTEKGLRQGDALACMLFNIALEKVVRYAGIEKKRNNIS
jgi:hypothetical protein